MLIDKKRFMDLEEKVGRLVLIDHDIRARIKRFESIEKQLKTNAESLEIMSYYFKDMSVNKYISFLHCMYPNLIDTIRHRTERNVEVKSSILHVSCLEFMLEGNMYEHDFYGLYFVPIAISFESKVTGDVEICNGGSRVYEGEIKDENWMPVLLPGMDPFLIEEYAHIKIQSPDAPKLWGILRSRKGDKLLLKW